MSFAAILRLLGGDRRAKHSRQSFRGKMPLGVERLEDRSLLAVADLVAYRPVTQFIDHTQFPVPEAVETDAKLGPGIRVNGDDDNGNGVRDFLDTAAAATGENDLIRVDVSGSTGAYTTSWTGALAVWTSPDKAAAIANGAVDAIAAGQSLWVEYTSDIHTAPASPASLSLSVTDNSGTATDTVSFHSFKSVVIAIGGFTQSPAHFGDPRLGVFTTAGTLYSQGYDVHLFAENQVQATGKGAAYNEVANAVLARNVDNVGIIGHSWGGGATYQLAAGLKANKALAAAGYKLQYTAYVDAIRHGSIKAETRKPPGSRFHDNFYQRRDLFLRGNKVAWAHNVHVNKTAWGTNLVHTTIDDNANVQALLIADLQLRLTA